MPSNNFQLGALLIALGASASAFAANADDVNGAGAAAAGNNAPPEKVRRNVATAPGVIAPKPTPPPDAIAPSAPSDGATPGAPGLKKGNDPSAK